MNLNVGSVVVWRCQDSGTVLDDGSEFELVERGQLGIVVRVERQSYRVADVDYITVLLSDGRPFRTSLYVENVHEFLEVL